MDLEMKTFLEGFEQRMNVRFDGIDKRFNGIDVRLDSIDARLNGQDSRLDRIERNQEDMQGHIAYLIQHFGKFEDDVRAMLRSHDVRLTNLESRVQFV